MATKKISVGALIALITTGIFLSLVTSGVLLSSQQVSSNGTVLSTVGVGVYNDQPCTQNCTSISWGTLTPGSSTVKTIYVKNTGTLPVTLSMNVSGWSSANASAGMTVTWNKAAATLNASQSVAADITLTVSPTIDTSVTNFGFNITITGTQT
jgi:hypothetical protein